MTAKNLEPRTQNRADENPEPRTGNRVDLGAADA